MKKIILLLMLILLLPTSSFAQVERFVDNNFDFSKVKTVYFIPLVSGQPPALDDKQLFTTDPQALKSTNNLTVLTTKEMLEQTVKNYKYNFNGLTRTMWPQAYVVFLKETQKHADLIVFTDVVEYSSPPARVEEINLTPADTTLTTANSSTGATTETVNITAVPVFLPDGDFPTLRFYVVSAHDLNVPVMSVYYKIDTTDNSLQNIDYDEYLKEFFADLTATVGK